MSLGTLSDTCPCAYVAMCSPEPPVVDRNGRTNVVIEGFWIRSSRCLLRSTSWLEHPPVSGSDCHRSVLVWGQEELDCATHSSMELLRTAVYSVHRAKAEMGMCEYTHRFAHPVPAVGCAFPTMDKLTFATLKPRSRRHRLHCGGVLSEIPHSCCFRIPAPASIPEHLPSRRCNTLHTRGSIPKPTAQLGSGFPLLRNCSGPHSDTARRNRSDWEPWQRLW